MVGGTGAVLLGVVIGAAVTALQYMGERSKQTSMQYPSSATLSDIEGSASCRRRALQLPAIQARRGERMRPARPLWAHTTYRLRSPQ